MAQNNINSKKGFTIIEVVLVLAVAGLIVMMVFLGYPALRRSQNDTQRRDQLAALVTQITQYQANNRNRLPDSNAATVTPNPDDGQIDSTVDNGWANFYRNYLLAGGDIFEDPNGVPYSLEVITCDVTSQANGAECKTQRMNSTFEEQDYKILITYHSTCDGEKIIYNTGARKLSVAYKLEGGGTFCQAN
ncbi:type II secretion system protein [Candidatus Saccharibacteria bacterium]|nr:type II secretion system protein [Candidatus Saccharibacteria bacterium]